MQIRIPRVAAMLAFSAIIPNIGFASCGSAFCVLNTNWDIQGINSEPGRAKLDLRYEFIKQDQLRAGTRNISPADDTSDVTELKTINHNLLATLDYAISHQWVISAALPLVSRSHAHIADPTGAATLESWNLAKHGDTRVLGRYQFEQAAHTADNYGIQFGVKFPSGDSRVANADGTVAERALQPGTGSTDVIVGGYYSYYPSYQGMSWFAQALYQSAVSSKDGFRPGDQFSINAGMTYHLSDKTALLFQGNGLVKRGDSGINAEPNLSGGRYVFASPGLSYAAGKDTQVYGFLQLPLYQHVNGVQLVADKAVIVGVTTQF